MKSFKDLQLRLSLSLVRISYDTDISRRKIPGLKKKKKIESKSTNLAFSYQSTRFILLFNNYNIALLVFVKKLAFNFKKSSFFS